jgi:hypothetical protein
MKSCKSDEGEKDTGSAFKDESHLAKGKYATMDEGKESGQAQFPHHPFIASTYRSHALESVKQPTSADLPGSVPKIAF